MCHTVYFADKSVCFTSNTPPEDCAVVAFAADTDVSRAKILKILETNNCVAVCSADPDGAFRAFAAEFTWVEAAGGVVVNGRGERLMILRNGRWDLPKGHIEPGESPEQAAVREIAEETGVDGAQVVRPLCRTFHAYYFPKTARWELKCTHWFELRVASCDALEPQHEEGIERVEWCAGAQQAAHLADTFPTIGRVIEAML